MTNEKAFAQRLRALRRKAGLKQEELSNLLDISTKTVQRWEYAERLPRADELQRIAAELHVTEAELLNGPEQKEIRITLHYSEMPKEAEINMGKNEFDLFLSGKGTLGIKGAACFKTVQDIDDFLARAREQLVEGLTFQQSRGAIEATA